MPEGPAGARGARGLSEVREVPTRVGTARAHLSGQGSGLLVLGHGAGGGVDAPDLLAARDAAHERGLRVALVEQPWRVEGKRVAVPPPRLDQAWVDVLATLRGAPLLVGGRSAGARVACRTAAEVGAAGVLCLAFPLHPPGRPERSREAELAAVPVPVLVVQGDRDPFGVPAGAVVVPGADHGFRTRKGVEAPWPLVRTVVGEWLAGFATT